jgi:hypothetical protein
MYYLDGDLAQVGGIRIAGLGGIIGNPDRPQRRRAEDYLATLERLVSPAPELLLMHEGPDGVHAGQRGSTQVREMLEASGIGLVIRGHAHWDEPFAEFSGGLQVLNVDSRVVVLTL